MTQSMNESVTRLFVEQPLASPVSAIYIQTAYIVFKAVKQTQLLRQTCSVKLARTGRSREKYCWDNLTTKQTKNSRPVNRIACKHFKTAADCADCADAKYP